MLGLILTCTRLILNLIFICGAGFHYASVAEVDKEQSHMSFTGMQNYSNYINICLLVTIPHIFLLAADRSNYDTFISAEADTDVTKRLLHENDGSTLTQTKSEYASSTAIIEDTKENEKELARRIPWGYFLSHPAALTLLFAYWVMSWIGMLQMRFHIQRYGIKNIF